MRKINKNEDIIDVLTGEIDLVKSVKYYTHLDSETTIEPTITKEDNALICRIPSSSLQSLETGQLMCEIELQSADEAFDDSTYDTNITEGLNIWLV